MNIYPRTPYGPHPARHLAPYAAQARAYGRRTQARPHWLAQPAPPLAWAAGALVLALVAMLASL
jgi:hypothetical protein